MDTCLAQMENLKIGEPEPVTGVAFSCDTPGTHTGGQPCRLLTVAPEIRNKIYELALYDNNEGLVDLLSAASPSKNFLLSCHQVYEEAKGIHAEAYRRYWRETRFVLRANDGSASWHGISVDFTEHDLAQIRHMQFSATIDQLQYRNNQTIHVTLPAHIPKDGVWGLRCLFDRLPKFGEWWCAPTTAEPSRRLHVNVYSYDVGYGEGVGLETLQWADGWFHPINTDELSALMVCKVVLKGTSRW
ncbi:hypothetical protein LTR56_025138 [Elasticomyces elasticus]|nr:hypothetical protein LTR56_025138 [Elasticomyces elasticus]KAK4904869.1 hypothetical protein LTR49_025760 [Elasticomyces elasticus]KAK5741023.1 hypothetical protein LTS12_024743 [Elasticomyces elasticus]